MSTNGSDETSKSLFIHYNHVLHTIHSIIVYYCSSYTLVV